MIKNKKSLLIIFIVVTALSATALFAYIDSNKDKRSENISAESHDSQSSEEATSEISTDPKANIENNKENSNDGGSKKKVTPIITFAGVNDGNVSVRAYVPGIIEDGGICTMTFTKGSLKVTRDVEGIEDATTTQCKNISISTNQFPENGIWELTVYYNSGSSTGNSEVKQVEIK